jgi:hypothetical protein
MESIGFALCEALHIDRNSTMPERQVIKALFQNYQKNYTGNPVKDNMLSKIAALGGKLMVDPRFQSTREVRQELIRCLKVRALPADPKTLTLIIRGRPVDPVDKLTLAIFGVY